MQLRLPFGSPGRQPGARRTLLLGRRPIVVTYVRHRRARHYVLRVQDDGSVRVTVPRGGGREEAERFIREKAEWIEREQHRADLRRAAGREASATRVSVFGEECEIAVVSGPNGSVARFGGFEVDIPPGPHGALAPVERFLRAMATDMLPRRLHELAERLGRRVAGVVVRGQRTRWGSCSPSGRISLNWRLIEMPRPVSDYVLLHELTHLVHLNHSKRFWRELERVCPWHREARAWLRTRTAASRASH